MGRFPVFARSRPYVQKQPIVDLNSFNEAGFVVADDVIDSKSCDDLCSEMDSFIVERAGSRSLLSHPSCCRLATTLKYHPKIGRLLSRTPRKVSAGVYLFHSRTVGRDAQRLQTHPRRRVQGMERRSLLILSFLREVADVNACSVILTEAPDDDHGSTSRLFILDGNQIV